MNLCFLLKLQDYSRFGWKGADVLQMTPRATDGTVAWTSQGSPFACTGLEAGFATGAGFPLLKNKFSHNKFSLTKSSS